MAWWREYYNSVRPPSALDYRTPKTADHEFLITRIQEYDCAGIPTPIY
ncbi:transposase [Thermosulfurimonas marina]|uniref:Transposase n=1 Tax=Thermosulfurimonas marina TaxID=2047767 RepID=A0A6H1WUZ0_9BACT|nr:transposase [Thermosulfurimonas marina]